MGKSDAVTRTYIRENAVFADAVNYLIYNGKPVIEPENLREMDTAELAVLSEKAGKKKNVKTVVKYRDLLKLAVLMEDMEATYLIVGIEEQTKIHYAMPVRNMIYDALEYGKQVTDTATIHKQENTEGDPEYQPNEGEYLSGFHKTDKLKPIITIVIHFGAEAWDAPMSLHEMLDTQNSELLKYVQDYKIHLIEPARMSEEDLEKFQTSLGTVMGYIKYSKDKEQFARYKEKNQGKLLENKAAQVIRFITGIPMEIDEKEEKQDMCKAFDEMLEDSRNEGRSEGKVAGRLEGLQEGERTGKLGILSQLIEQGLLTLETAAAQINMTPEEFQKAITK